MNYMLSWKLIQLIVGHIKIKNHQRGVETVLGATVTNLKEYDNGNNWRF